MKPHLLYLMKMKNRIIKKLVYPVAYLLVLLLLTIMMVKVVTEKYGQQKKAIKELKRSENILQSKLALFDKYQNDLSSYVLKSTTALPEKNPALAVISQIGKIQAENLVQISDLKFNLSGQSEKGVNTLHFSFTVDGDFAGLMAFLDALSKTSPLVVLDKIELTRSGDVFSAGVKTISFWQAFPEKIPSTTDEIKDLTREESDLLTILMTLNEPVFSDVLPQGSSSRINPFQ